MIKCGLLGLLSVVLSIVSSLVFFDYSSAISPEDGAYKSTDTLYIGDDNYYSMECDIEDVKNKWFSIAMESNHVYDESTSWKPSLEEAFNDKKNNSIVVSQNVEYDQSDKPRYTYTISWTEDRSYSLYWYLNTVYGQSSVMQQVNIGTGIAYGLDCGFYIIQYSANGTNAVVSQKRTGNTETSNFFINIDENKINYPPNYEGENVVISDGGNGNDPYDPNPNKCEGIDIGCWISSAFDRVVDSFQSFWDGFVAVIEGIMQFIGNIFLPSDDNILVGFFERITASLSNKFGTLLYPYQFITDWTDAMFFTGGFNVIDCGNGNSSPWFCYYEVKNFAFGSDFVINIRQTETLLKDTNLYGMLVLVLGRVVGAIIFIMLAHSAYMRITDQMDQMESEMGTYDT